MFTGIVEEIGTIVTLSETQLTVHARRILADVAIGDSISVDGICLTVERFDSSTFTVGLSPETIRRTTLEHRLPGASVNLESALRAGGKIGGHFVSGHIDGVGRCVKSTQSGTSWEMDFEVPAEVSRYIVEKGSIAINGVSLTVAACKNHWFRIAVIPHSFDQTTLGALRAGTPVNLEADLLGKYVEKLLSLGSQSKETLSLAFLRENGYA
ncbi:MAG: riboflavin synthase [Anaerolineae bacterium]|nr:riboflavin synthase [Gloeobacterales cyanobacterium ES-bin-313]